MSKSIKKDKLFSKSMKVTDFKFDEKVANVFDDMLNRSIPFYRETQDMTLRLALNFVKKNTRIYDLGCSTGTVIKRLAKLVDKSVKLVGVDDSPAMLKKAALKLLGIDKTRLRIGNSSSLSP